MAVSARLGGSSLLSELSAPRFSLSRPTGYAVATAESLINGLPARSVRARFELDKARMSVGTSGDALPLGLVRAAAGGTSVARGGQARAIATAHEELARRSSCPLTHPPLCIKARVGSSPATRPPRTPGWPPSGRGARRTARPGPLQRAIPCRSPNPSPTPTKVIPLSPWRVREFSIVSAVRVVCLH